MFQDNRTSTTPSGVGLPLTLLVVATLALASCAGHAARTQLARTALDKGAPERALALYNEELEVKSATDLPADTGGDNALLLLDRAVILQQLDNYDLSARDLRTADKQIELLDFSRNVGDELGKYLFSDDTGPYKSPPYEKLMINTINMINYLATRDLNGARIEARRFAVLQKYLRESDSPSKSLMGAGSYLAGFVFERSNEPQSALRYYDEALQYGDFRTLTSSIVRLSKEASYRTPRINKILAQQGADGPHGDTESPEENPADVEPSKKNAELLVVLSFGRVPAKIAKRVPIGLALTYAAGAISPADRARADRLAAQGLVTWVNFPTLGKARGEYAKPQFGVDGDWQPLDGVPVDRHAVEAWNEAQGAVVAAAITRMLARAVTGQAAKKASGDGAGGLVLSLLAQATLTAADTPDTRSWSTLPARIALGRISLPPGTHKIELRARGRVLKKQIELKPGGWGVLSLTELR